MDESMVESLTSIVTEISTSVETDPNCWRDHLQTIRSVTASLDLAESTPESPTRQWQLSLLQVFQRVAYADADNGGVSDIANWCLRQALALLQVSSDDVDLLFCMFTLLGQFSTDSSTVIGRNWLLRAQKSLAKIHHNEPDTSSSGASSGHPLSRSEEQRQVSRAEIEADERLYTGDYVEARGILLPAIEYLKRAVDSARSQGRLTGHLLTQAAEAYMSLGNVSPSRVNSEYFHEALTYLRAANDMDHYNLPAHLQQYLEEYGPLDTMMN